MPTEKQSLVLGYLAKNGQSKKCDILCDMPFGYYHNEQKHFGQILTNMVKNGMIRRVSSGVYDLPVATKNTNQEELFLCQKIQKNP